MHKIRFYTLRNKSSKHIFSRNVRMQQYLILLRNVKTINLPTPTLQKIKISQRKITSQPYEKHFQPLDSRFRCRMKNSEPDNITKMCQRNLITLTYTHIPSTRRVESERAQAALQFHSFCVQNTPHEERKL